MKNIIGLMAIIFFLASQFCLSQTDHLNISWNQNPPEDSVLYYRLYRAYAVGENADINFNLSPSSNDYLLRFDNINDTSIVDPDNSVILPGNFIQYTVTAVNLHGESERAIPKGKGIPKIRWVDSNSVLYNDSLYILPYDSVAYDLDDDAMDLKFSLDNASLQNIIINIDSLNHNLQVSSDLNNYTGPASFILEVNDPEGFWDRDTVSLKFIEDLYIYLQTDADTTDEDTPIELNLIENDSIPTGYSYSLELDTLDLTYGRVEKLNDSLVNYIPLALCNSLAQNEIAYDNFGYRIFNDSANVQIIILGLNDPPTISGLPDTLIFYPRKIQHLAEFSNDIDNSASQLNWEFKFANSLFDFNYDSTSKTVQVEITQPNITDTLETGWFILSDIFGLKDSSEVTVKFNYNTKPQFVNSDTTFIIIEDSSFSFNLEEMVNDSTDRFEDLIWGDIPSSCGNLLADTSLFPVITISSLPVDRDTVQSCYIYVRDPGGLSDTLKINVSILNKIDLLSLSMNQVSNREMQFIINLGTPGIIDVYFGVGNFLDRRKTSHIYQTQHILVLDSLQADSTYFFRIEATDQRGIESNITPGNNTFQINPPAIGEPYTFPNPYRPSHGHDQVFFDNIPSDAEKIVIFDVATNEVYSHNFRGTPTRRWGWNVINDDGKELASGLYIYVIFGPGNKKIKSGKIAVIR